MFYFLRGFKVLLSSSKFASTDEINLDPLSLQVSPSCLVSQVLQRFMTQSRPSQLKPQTAPMQQNQSLRWAMILIPATFSRP